MKPYNLVPCDRVKTPLVTKLTSRFAVVPILLTVIAVEPSLAAPADVFTPHLDRIQQLLPPNYAMRLPSRILLGGPADEEFIQRLVVRIVGSSSPTGVTVGLYSCADSAPTCLIGTFAVASGASTIAQREFNQHMDGAAPIQLTKDIRGYLLERPTNQPPFIVSSVMWQQDGLLYTARFAAPERQNMLYMAVSMANNHPIYAVNAALKTLPNRTRPR